MIGLQVRRKAAQPAAVHGFYFMFKRYVIPFFCCIILLIGSEYFLLQEVYAEKRLFVLLLCSLGMIASIVAFLFFWKAYRRFTK